MKRFYNLVSTEKAEEGYHILLDGRPVKRKSGGTLACLNEHIANRVRREWSEQKEDVIPDSMPFTQIENTRLDRVVNEREAMSINVLKFLDTDLLCYMTDMPKDLALRQDASWGPWRKWFDEKFDVSLQTTTGLAALTQDPKAHLAAKKYVQDLDDPRFTILQIVVPACGSLILGLAFLDGAANAQDVFDAIFVEENYKAELYDAEKYGADPLTQKKQNATQNDLQAAFEYLSYL